VKLLILGICLPQPVLTTAKAAPFQTVAKRDATHALKTTHWQAEPAIVSSENSDLVHRILISSLDSDPGMFGDFRFRVKCRLYGMPGRVLPRRTTMSK
jgi:hypothetical protein